MFDGKTIIFKNLLSLLNLPPQLPWRARPLFDDVDKELIIRGNVDIKEIQIYTFSDSP